MFSVPNTSHFRISQINLQFYEMKLDLVIKRLKPKHGLALS